MFDKLKSRKAPLSLSSVSNALRNSGSSLSPEISPKSLKMALGDQLGLPIDSIVAVAHDPVQSLFAVATNRNSIHVYGQHSVEVVFELKTSGTVHHLKFVKGIYLVAIESSGNVTVLSLHSKKILASYSPPGAVTAVQTDPSLDWLILGLANGSVIFYDVDRFHLTPLRVDNLQKVVLPKQKLSPVLHIQWHPRDIGTVLLTYSHCAIQYSVSGGGIKNAFIYQLKSDCAGFEHSNFIETGGKKKLFGSAKEVVPRMKEAHYHPNGLHVLTVHADGTLVFFDGNDGKLLEARTIKHTGLHKPGPPITFEECSNIRAKWVTGQDPELTQIVVAGASAHRPDELDVLELGYTLKYSLTSHEKQGEFYARPSEGMRRIPVKFNRRSADQGPLEYITQILPICAEGQPYFDGGHNPSHIALVSSLGALYVVPYLSTSLPLKLPPSLATAVPPTTYSAVESVRRRDWLGSLSSSRAGQTSAVMLSGGAPVSRHHPRPLGLNDDFKDILVSGHEDGTVRCLDVTGGDHVVEEREISFNLKDTLDTNSGSSPYRVTQVSFGFECMHAIVGLANGNVAICKFGKLPAMHRNEASRQNYDSCKKLYAVGDASIVDLTQRVAGTFVQPSFIPTALLKLDAKDSISCLKLSNSGFAAIAYKSGKLIVCDITRGPAIILNLDSVVKHLPSVTSECYVTTMEFAIMEYGQDGFSSLLLFAGTNAGGNFMTFKIVPQGNGAFEAIFADKTLGLNYKSTDTDNAGLNRIMPINASTGESAVATMEMFMKLAQNVLVPGLVVVSSPRDLRVLKAPKQKLSHKVVDETCLSSGIVTLQGKGAVLASVTKSGFVKLFSLPSLGDIADVKIDSDSLARLQKSFNNGKAFGSSVLYSGQIYIKLNASETVSLIVYDTNKNKPPKEKPTDILFNETAIIPPRPAAGTVSWVKGQSTYISSKDLTLLIAGPNRKAPKHPESELAYNISPEANPNMSYGGYGAAATGKSKTEGGYAEPVRRTANTNPYAMGTSRIMRGIQDGLDTMEESVNHYANGLSETMGETVDSSKKSMYTSAFKSKFGF